MWAVTVFCPLSQRLTGRCWTFEYKRKAKAVSCFLSTVTAELVL